MDKKIGHGLCHASVMLQEDGLGGKVKCYSRGGEMEWRLWS
jgi:hypothetical protein